MRAGQASDSTRYGTVPTAPRQMGYLERVRESGEALYAQRRPWRDLVSHTAFGKPDSFADAFSRIRRNLAYFRVNYALIILGIVFLSLLWHPISLIVLIVMFVAWGFLYFFRDEPVVVFGRTLNEGVVIGVLSIVTFVALMLTHATMVFLIGLLIAVFIVAVHAAFQVPEDLFLNEDEAAAGGLLSVVDGSIPVSSSRV